MKEDRVLELHKRVKSLKTKMRNKIKEKLKEFDLTDSQGMIVGILMHEGSQKISEISSKLQLSNATVSGLVDRLEGKQKVIRYQDEKDKRIVFVDLSKEFKEELKCSDKTPAGLMIGPFKNATEKELEQIINTLQLIEEIFNRGE